MHIYILIILEIKLYFSKPFSIDPFPPFSSTLAGSGSGAPSSAQGAPGTGGAGGTLTTQAAFEYRGIWIPLMTVSVQGSAKAT